VNRRSARAPREDARERPSTGVRLVIETRFMKLVGLTRPGVLSMGRRACGGILHTRKGFGEDRLLRIDVISCEMQFTFWRMHFVLSSNDDQKLEASAHCARPPHKRRPVCGDPGSGDHFVVGIPVLAMGWLRSSRWSGSDLAWLMDDDWTPERGMVVTI
jgi:hypothetical protein